MPQALGTVTNALLRLLTQSLGLSKPVKRRHLYGRTPAQSLTGTPEYPVRLLSLANTYFFQYLATPLGGTWFTEAEKLYDELIKFPAESVDPQTRWKALQMFGTALVTRCDTDVMNNLLPSRTYRLDEAIDYLDEALTLSTDESSHERGTDTAIIHALCLYDLGNAYATRYRFTDDSRDLDRAIDYYCSAKDEIPAGHPHCAPCFFNLALQLYTRHQATKLGGPVFEFGVKSIGDLREASRIAGDAQRLLWDPEGVNSWLKQDIGKLLDEIETANKSLSPDFPMEDLPPYFE